MPARWFLAAGGTGPAKLGEAGLPGGDVTARALPCHSCSGRSRCPSSHGRRDAGLCRTRVPTRPKLAPRGQLLAKERWPSSTAGAEPSRLGFFLCLGCPLMLDPCFLAHPGLRRRTQIRPYLQNKALYRVIYCNFQTTDNIFHLLSALKSFMVSILCTISDVFASV